MALLAREIMAKSRIGIAIAGTFLLLLTFLAGLGGVRQALICYVPTFLAAFINLYLMMRRYDIKCLLCEAGLEVGYLLAAAMAIMGFAVGFLVNSRVLSNQFMFARQSEYLWEQFTIESMLAVISDMFSVFGFFHDVSFMGPLGIVNALSLCACGVLIVSVIRILRRFNKLNPELRFYVTASLMIFAVNAFVFACNNSAYNLLYWSPVVPLLIPFWGLFDYDEANGSEIVINRLIRAVIIFSIFMSSIATIKYPIDKRISYAEDYEKYRAGAEAIEKLGYSEGFAPFWIANTLTELTNGKIEIWATGDADMARLNDSASVMPWLQEKRHLQELPENRFLVITYGRILDDDYIVKCPLFKTDSNMLYSDDYITVYGFENMEEYQNLLMKISDE